jgi:hypothetical protein
VKNRVKIPNTVANQISLGILKNSNMKKIFILTGMLFWAAFSFSQSLDDINELMGKKDYKAAKAGIDKYLSEGSNASKADGWYYKGRIYNSLSNDKTIAETELLDLKTTAFEAFKKYQQLDSKDLRMKLENYASYLDLYYGLYDLGANLFNKKSYPEAYSSFKKALEVEEYIQMKKYSYPQVTLAALDTSLVLNTAIAATQAKKEDESIPYYRKIVDANIAGDNYRDVYGYLVEYYNKKGDAASYADILAKGKKFYPKDNYWNQVELDNISKSGDQTALFAKYDEMLAKDQGNFALAYNYAVELYNRIKKDDKPTEGIELKDKLTSVLKIAIASDTGIDATVLLANHLYNMAVDYNNASIMIKGTKPDDVKKRNELKASSLKNADDCISYSEKAVKYFEPKVADLKASQKANYKIIMDYLTEMYNLKGNKAKVDEYTKKRALIK